MLIEDLVEKPHPEQAPSNLAIAGTYVLTPAIFDCIDHTAPGLNGEVQLTDALRLLRKREEIYGWRFEGKTVRHRGHAGLAEDPMRARLGQSHLRPRARVSIWSNC